MLRPRVEIKLYPQRVSALEWLVSVHLDSHGEEGAVYKDQRESKEDCCQRECKLRRKFDSKLDGKETKQRGELDDRVQSNRRGVLERIADRISHNRGIMKRSTLGIEFSFNNLLRVIPCTTGIGHEDGLIETEKRNGDQVTNKEE